MEIFKDVKIIENGNVPLKMTFWPNKKCDIPGYLLMHAPQALKLRAQGWVLKNKGHGISLFYHGKVVKFKVWKKHKLSLGLFHVKCTLL